MCQLSKLLQKVEYCDLLMEPKSVEVPKEWPTGKRGDKFEVRFTDKSQPAWL